MDKMLRRLETFHARGNDGKAYSVHAFEHLRRIGLFSGGEDAWESTGQAEYKLADGQPLQVGPDGSLVVARTGVRLERETTAA